MASSTSSVEMQALETEKRYWQATRDRDFDAMPRLTADSLVLVQGEGIATFGREDFASMIRDGDFRLGSFEIDEGSVKSLMIGDDVCFIAYRVKQNYTRGNSAGSGVSFNTSVLIKSDSGWQRTAHTISLP